MRERTDNAGSACKMGKPAETVPGTVQARQLSLPANGWNNPHRAFRGCKGQHAHNRFVEELGRSFVAAGDSRQQTGGMHNVCLAAQGSRMGS